MKDFFHPKAGLRDGSEVQAGIAKRILIVDQAAAMREYLRDLLEKAAYRVEEATSANDALAKALSHPFDLYVVEATLPERDGLSFLRSLRAADIEQGPAIMVSSEASPDDVAAAFAAGANDYLLKPVHPQWFVIHVRLLLGEERS